jgi:Family of unknown function (DUF6338)
MTEFKPEALTVLIILLPGFLAAKLEQRLTIKGERTEFDKIIDALLYSFLSYILYSSFTKSFPFDIRDTVTAQGHEYAIITNAGLLAVLASIAIALAILKSYLINRDMFGKLFRTLRISQKTWRDSTWSDVFHTYGEAVQVQLSDGRSVMGWLKHYSDDAEEGCIFLERAAWVADDTLIEIDGPGILLSKKSEISSISFLHWKVSDTPGLFKDILS